MKLSTKFVYGSEIKEEMHRNEQIIQNELNRIWGEWNIDCLLGEGAYGKVFKIIREDFGHTYEAALKVITIPQNQSEINAVMSDGMDEKSATSYFKSIVEDLVEEFALMSKLKGNTNIVSYEDHAVVPFQEGIGWNIYIRMELLTPLYSFMKEHPMSIRDVINLGIDMCQALEVCQRYNIIHRDIKPENVFVSDLGRYKLGDFGIARQLEGANTGMSRKGTYTYMAPDVYKGEEYNSTVDIYSLGIMLYRFLNNNRAPFLPPYPQPLRHSDSEHAIILRMSGANIPSPCNAKGRLAEIVLKACAYEPKDRYESAADMKRALQSVLYDEKEAGVIYPRGDRLKNTETASNQYYKNTSAGIDESEEQETVVLDSENFAAITNKRDKSKHSHQNPKLKKVYFVAGIVTIVAMVTIVSGVVLYQANKSVTVPGVLNMSVKEASKKAGALRLVEEGTQYSETVEKGKIISQSIKEGDKAKRGSSIKVIVSGGKLMKAPSFVGTSYEEAVGNAADANLKIAVAEKKYSADIAKGLIMEQSIAPGEQLEEGQTISVVISEGTEQTIVPDVAGMKLSKAKKTLKKQKLTYSIEKEYSDSVGKDKIVEQSVKAKKSVDVGTEIQLIVSKGKKKATSSNTSGQQPSYSAPKPQNSTPRKKSSTSNSSDKGKVDDFGDWDVVN